MAKKSFSASIPAEMFFTAAPEPVNSAEKQEKPVEDRKEIIASAAPVLTEKNVIKARESRPENQIPKGYKLNPMYIETKSRRLQLLIKPSTYEKIKAIAAANGISVNEQINLILEEV